MFIIFLYFKLLNNQESFIIFFFDKKYNKIQRHLKSVQHCSIDKYNYKYLLRCKIVYVMNYFCTFIHT